jgi:hypothetical protein
LQISRQKPAKASLVRQPKKVYFEMTGMGAKSITIVRAVTADFFFECRAAEIPSDECKLRSTYSISIRHGPHIKGGTQTEGV